MSDINKLVFESLNNSMNRKSSSPNKIEDIPVNDSINRKTIRQSGQNLSPEQNISKKNIIYTLKNLQG